MGLKQFEYAEKIGVKRATLNNWEGGRYRLSLDGALALRKQFELTLDFLFFGSDESLPDEIKKAWRDI